MKRRLSSREKILLGILLILVAVSAYYLWFYIPSQDKLMNLEAQIQGTQDTINADKIKIAKKEKMEQELAEIFAENEHPVSMAAYDNSQNVMFELNTILSQTEDYSLNFEAPDTTAEDGIVRRRISLQFQCGSYEAAKAVLQELHDSTYRCMLDGLTLDEEEKAVTTGGYVGGWLANLIEGEENTETESHTYTETVVKVSATLVFFEYQADAAP